MLLLRHQALIYVFSKTYNVITVRVYAVTPCLFLPANPKWYIYVRGRKNIKWKVFSEIFISTVSSNVFHSDVI